jgi:hypothetical protein
MIQSKADDLSKMQSRPNRHALQLKKSVTMRFSVDLIQHSKDLAAGAGAPHQRLINLYSAIALPSILVSSPGSFCQTRNPSTTPGSSLITAALARLISRSLRRFASGTLKTQNLLC